MFEQMTRKITGPISHFKVLGPGGVRAVGGTAGATGVCQVLAAPRFGRRRTTRSGHGPPTGVGVTVSGRGDTEGETGMSLGSRTWGRDWSPLHCSPPWWSARRRAVPARRPRATTIPSSSTGRRTCRHRPRRSPSRRATTAPRARPGASTRSRRDDQALQPARVRSQLDVRVHLPAHHGGVPASGRGSRTSSATTRSSTTRTRCSPTTTSASSTTSTPVGSTRSSPAWRIAFQLRPTSGLGHGQRVPGHGCARQP